MRGPFAGSLCAGFVENHFHQRFFGAVGIGKVDHPCGDLDEEAFEIVAAVPFVEDVAELGVVEAGHVLEQVVGFGDELHVAVFDAVVDHLDEVASAFGTDVGDAGAGVGFGGDFGEDGLEVLIGIAVAAGHEAGTPERAFFAAADAHAEEFDAGAGELLHAPLGVGEEGIAAVDDDVAILQMRAELGDDGIDRSAGLDHDEDAARAFEELDEFLNGLAAFGIFAAGQFVEEMLGFGVGAVVDGDGEAVALDVERDVSPHHFESDDAECLACHGRLIFH